MNDIESWLTDALKAAFHESMERYFSGSPMREMVEYHFSLGGKRLRPLAVLLAAEALWQKHGKVANSLRASAIPYALAVELVHNATLIHDDIQDGDEFRRGQPAVWKKYSVAQGINCGDALFFAAQCLVQESAYGEKEKAALLKVLARESFAVIEGQSQEFVLKESLMRNPELVNRSAYERMVRGKTSALFVMAYAGGAILAGATEKESEEISRLAGSLGLAFQIQDDLLDLWGSKGRDQVGTDIAEGKLSYPIVLALGGLSTERAELRQILLRPRDKTEPSDIRWVTAELERCGAKNQAKADAERLLAQMTPWEPAFSPIISRLQNDLAAL